MPTKTYEDVELELEHFKRSMNEWILYLNQCYKETNERLQAIERRLARLELELNMKF